MANEILYIIGCCTISIGLFFILTAIIGIIKFDDVLAKLHAIGVSDSFGIPLCFFGILIIKFGTVVSAKAIILIAAAIFIFPASTHSFAKAYFIKNKIKIDIQK